MKTLTKPATATAQFHMHVPPEFLEELKAVAAAEGVPFRRFVMDKLTRHVLVPARRKAAKAEG
jgi:predicted DNA binding CopG/RHH family protein